MSIKAQKIIDDIDTLMPNQYTSEMKLNWLSELDGTIFDEVYKTHYAAPVESFEPYTTSDAELLVPQPYGHDIYVYYIEYKICSENAERQKANQISALYNAAYQNFVGWYNRTHLPRRKSGNRLHF